MIALAAEDIADLRRWAISAAVVVVAHGAVAASVMRWRVAVEPADTAAAIVIDFAPIRRSLAGKTVMVEASAD